MRVGHVSCVLISVLQSAGNLQVFRRLDGQFGLHIDACDMHPAKIHHRPTELLSFRIGDNLVMNGVVIAVGLNAKVFPEAVFPCLVINHTYVILQCRLWFQVGIPHFRIIHIVECRHAEAAFHKGAHREALRPERIYIHEDGWCQLVGRFLVCPVFCMVFDECSQQASLNLQALEV